MSVQFSYKSQICLRRLLQFQALYVLWLGSIKLTDVINLALETVQLKKGKQRQEEELE